MTQTLTPRTDEIEYQWVGFAHTGDRKPSMTMAEHARKLEAENARLAERVKMLTETVSSILTCESSLRIIAKIARAALRAKEEA